MEGGQKKYQEKGGKTFRRLVLASFALLLSMRAKCAIASTAAAAAQSSLPPVLDYRSLAKASSIIAVVGVLGLSRLGLTSMAKQLVVACSRCAIQLMFLGGFILQQLLPTKHWWLVASWILGIGFVASQEAYSRLEYTYPRLRQQLVVSVLVGGLSVLAIALGFGVMGSLQPWFQPRTWVPLAGMLFGNCVSATVLAASTLTKEFAVNQDQVELRLCHGATANEAVTPLITDSVAKGLTPTINSLSVTGLVHTPGTMTGQILAGQAARQATIYQIVASFLIAAIAVTTVQMIAMFTTKSLMDQSNHRLSIDNLILKNGEQSERIDAERPDDTSGSMIVMPKLLSSADAPNKEQKALFSAKNLFISRANLSLSLSIRIGDRVGITGPSGCGKTQILRTLAGLQDCDTDRMMLERISASRFSFSDWRTRVLYVSQGRPTVSGSPKEFYKQVKSFHNQRRRYKGIVQNRIVRTPMEIAQGWNLDAAAFDQPWSTLSGGESQRVCLAIALALQPDVLLLDESTNALDLETNLLVEHSLKEAMIPIVMVTHSQQQVDRFCTHQIDLSTTQQSTNDIATGTGIWE